MKDVETSIGNYVHCLTDTGMTKHLVNLPGSRLKTAGRGFFMQCAISSGAPCHRALQVVRFFIAPKKTRQSQRDIFSRSNKHKGTAPGSRSQCRSVAFLLSTSSLERPLVWPVGTIITYSWFCLRAVGSESIIWKWQLPESSMWLQAISPLTDKPKFQAGTRGAN